MTHLKAVLGILVGLAVLVDLTAFGSPDVTKERVEASLTPTFTNLYLQQQRLLATRR